MTPDPTRVASLVRIVLAGFEAERASWKAGLELCGMNICGPIESESHWRSVLDWAERGMADEDAEPEMDRAA